MPLNLLLLRKLFLTLDGITRRFDPDFNAWLETLAYASGVFASEAVVRTSEHSIPVARPARFLSFRVAHANARGSFREHDCKKFVQIQKYFLAGFGNPCDDPFRSSGIARNPHNENKRSEKTRWPLQF